VKRLLLLGGVAAAAWWLGKRRGEQELAPVDVSEPSETLWPLDRPRGDDGVLGALAMFDEHQIAAAEIALNRPLPDEVQTLAAMLRDEHREHLARTRELVDQLGLELSQDPAVASIEGRCYERRTHLASANDDDFEQAYLEEVVDDHERMLEFLDAALVPAANDERVAEHVRETRKHLAMHLAEARMLA
jgi:putative membrane protein